MANEDIVYFIASVVLIDGEVSQQEKDFLRELCKQLGITQEVYSKIICRVKEGRGKISIPTNPEDKVFLFKLLLQAIFCDGKFSPEEQRILNRFSCKIGITPDELGEAIAVYKPSTVITSEQDEISQSDEKTEDTVDDYLQKQILSKKILNWKDTYKARIEEDLTNAFPTLDLRLKEAVNNNILDMVKVGVGPKKFVKKILEPEIISWIKRYAEPVLNSAQEDLTQIISHTINPDKNFREGSLENAEFSNIGMDILAPIAVIIAGIGTMVAGILLSITTFLWFFTMINWPLLIGGIVIGGALNILGVMKLSQLKLQLSDRFSHIFMPKIRDALIGEGYKQDDKKFPSLKGQLQDGIDQAATTILSEIRK